MATFTYDVGLVDQYPYSNDSFFDSFYTRAYYAFTTNSESSINLNLHEISYGDNANLRLYEDSDGDGVLDYGEPLLESSMKSGSVDDTINYRAEAGDYIGVVTYSNSGSDSDSSLTYSLDISATDIFPWPDTAPNLLPEDEFGPIGSYQGDGITQIDQSVGDDDTSDVFFFDIPYYSDYGAYPVEIRLEELTSDADIRLIDDQNYDNIANYGEVIASSTYGGTTSDVIRTYLDGGDYYLQVYQYSGDADYHLEFDEFDPYETLVAEEDLGVIYGYLDPITGFIGDYNQIDTYSFDLYDGQVDIHLTGLTADADMKLIQDFNYNGMVDDGEVIDGSYAGGSASEMITLDSNNYSGQFFLQVYQYNGDTNYDLEFDYV